MKAAGHRHTYLMPGFIPLDAELLESSTYTGPVVARLSFPNVNDSTGTEAKGESWETARPDARIFKGIRPQVSETEASILECVRRAMDAAFNALT